MELGFLPQNRKMRDSLMGMWPRVYMSGFLLTLVSLCGFALPTQCKALKFTGVHCSIKIAPSSVPCVVQVFVQSCLLGWKGLISENFQLKKS